MARFEMLRKDHKKAKEVLSKIIEEGSPEEPAKHKLLLKDLYVDLHNHMEAEEKNLYPVLKSHPAFADEAQDAYDEHAEAREILDYIKLQDFEITTDHAITKLKELLDELEHHIEDEEEEIFPKMEKEFPEEELKSLEDAVNKHVMLRKVTKVGQVIAA